MNEDGEKEDQVGDLFTLHDLPNALNTGDSKVVLEVDSNRCFMDSDSVLSFEDMEAEGEDGYRDGYSRESRQEESTSVLREEKSVISRMSMDDMISLSSKDPTVTLHNKSALSPPSSRNRNEDAVKLSAEEHFKSLALAEAAAKSGFSEFTTEDKISVLDRMELEENIIRTIKRQERRKRYERFFNKSKNFVKKTMKDIRPKSPNKRGFGDDQSQCSQMSGRSMRSQMSASQILGIDESSIKSRSRLQFKFRDQFIEALYDSSISYELASAALSSSLFKEWVKKTSRVFGTKRLDIHHVTIKWIEFAGKEKKVECIKMKVNSTFKDEELENQSGHTMQSLCTLRTNTVGLLVQLKCIEDGSTWSILVEQPRVPIGSVSTLELPPCSFDDETKSISGLVVDEMKKCGIKIETDDLIDLSKHAHDTKKISISNFVGLCPLPGNSNECIQIMLSTHEISRNKLSSIRSHMSELRDSGNLVTFRMIPILDMWRVSMDVKVMCALFLLDKLDLSSQKPIAGGIRENPAFARKAPASVGNSMKPEAALQPEKNSTVQVETSNRTPDKLQQASDAFDENREKLKRSMQNMFSSVKSTLKK